MTDRYENIRKALAMGPTPGPWVPKELPRDMQRDGYRFSISRGGLGWWIAKVTHEANGGSGAANAALIAACDPDTASKLLEERDALARENEALKRCAIKYLGWLGVTHMPLDQALHDDMCNPSMCGDAALADVRDAIIAMK